MTRRGAGGAAPHLIWDGSMSDEASENPTRVFIREAIDAGRLDDVVAVGAGLEALIVDDE